LSCASNTAVQAGALLSHDTCLHELNQLLILIRVNYRQH